MIFVDSNIPMYVIGADHPNKTRVLELLEQTVRDNEVFATSTEVFQEVLHRYTSIARIDAIGPAFDCLYTIADEVLAYDIRDIERHFGARCVAHRGYGTRGDSSNHEF